MKTLTIIISLFLPLTAHAAVIINELAWMGTDVSASDEWIELYNPDEQEINLEGWKLASTDGSPDIELTGTIAAQGFFLVERTDDQSAPDVTADQIYTGAMSNSGEQMQLLDASGQTIDTIDVTDGWPAGDNDLKLTMERTADGTGWHNSAEPGGTPRATNSGGATQPPDDPPDNDTPPSDPPGNGSPKPKPVVIKKGQIVINEILPNPLGPDVAGEFIELKNMTDSGINLTDFTIKNRKGKVFIIPPVRLPGYGFVVLYRHDSHLPLNNTKEQISLHSNKGRLIDKVAIKNPAPEAQSYNRTLEGKYIWTAEITAAAENIIPPKIIFPVLELYGPAKATTYQLITLDASDSFDPEDEKLVFHWDFGDGRIDYGSVVRQLYTRAGKYTITLTGETTKQATSSKQLKITIADSETKKDGIVLAATTGSEVSSEITTFDQAAPFIFISEVLPNPDGPDQAGEFVELFNADITPVNLRGWQLDDALGGSRPYIFDQDIIIKPGQYHAVWRTQTNVALNNGEDSVRLLYRDGNVVDQMNYEDSKEGHSWVLDEQFVWQQSQTPSPGEINILDQSDSTAPADLPTTTSPSVTKSESSITFDDEPADDRTLRYVVSTASAILVLGAGTFVKLRKAK